MVTLHTSSARDLSTLIARTHGPVNPIEKLGMTACLKCQIEESKA